jgi:hypothetical protein
LHVYCVFEANELATLRMCHKVDKLAEQQEMFVQNFSQANTLKRQESPQTIQRNRGHNARMSLFNNILRLKLEKAFTKESPTKFGLDYYCKNFPEQIFAIFGKYLNIENL